MLRPWATSTGTPQGDRPASFDGSADGVAALLAELATGPVDVLGFSNGGQVAMQLAIRHPEAVRRLVVASAPFRRDGMIDGFWDGLAAGTYADLPQPYREVPGNHGDYLGELAAAAGDPGPLQRTLPFIVDFLDTPARADRGAGSERGQR